MNDESLLYLSVCISMTCLDREKFCSIFHSQIVVAQYLLSLSIHIVHSELKYFINYCHQCERLIFVLHGPILMF
jgi:Fe-S-cluster-containing hydrogenase component 2